MVPKVTIELRRVPWILSLIALGLATACEEPNDLGKYCFVGAGLDPLDPVSDPSDNPECRTGLCFKQPGYKCADGSPSCDDPSARQRINPICTRACETRADCRGSSDNVNACQTFVCQKSEVEYGFPVDCHCVCLDYIRDAAGVALTPEAFDASDLACPTP
jgi:hypothetical protein